MNTDFLTQRRRGAARLFQKPGEVFVEGAGQTSANVNRNHLATCKGDDFFVNGNTQLCFFPYCRVETIKIGNQLVGILVSRDKTAIHPKTRFNGKEPGFSVLVDVVAVAGSAQTRNEFASLRVVGDAFDGLFHEGRVA